MNGNGNGNECGVRDERERERGAGLTATPARCGLNGNGNENARPCMQILFGRYFRKTTFAACFYTCNMKYASASTPISMRYTPNAVKS